MTFGHDVFQRGFSAEVLFHASDRAEISYRHHNEQCMELPSPYLVKYSSGKIGLSQQNYNTLDQAKAAATQFDPTGQYVDLGDLTPPGCDVVLKPGDPGYGMAVPEEEDSEPVLGCMDETATNYDPDATEDDALCEYDEDGSASGPGMVPLLLGSVALLAIVVIPSFNKGK